MYLADEAEMWLILPILPEAYRAEKLEQQLDEQVKNFLANTKKELIISVSKTRASKIFEWFEDDFEPLGGISAFISRYHRLPDNTKIATDIPYNWDLNKKS